MAPVPSNATSDTRIIGRTLRSAESTFDWLEARWESPAVRRATGTFLVAIFVVVLTVVEFGRRGWLPDALRDVVPRSHFVAVSVVFTFLLVLEVAGLIFALARSVANSVGKQFELLALILIREVFVELGNAGEPLEWAGLRDAMPHIAGNMLGALIVFALLVPFYRIQRHRAITSASGDQASFVRAKKVVSLTLLCAFIFLGTETVVGALGGRASFPFFASFYTILVLSDVLLVLVSLRYSTTFRVVFRNAAFAAATVLIRLALSAPPFVNVLLAAGATVFILATTMAYNAWREEDRSRTAVDTATTPPA